MKKSLILLSTILLISCSTRKSTTQTNKVDLKTETQTEVKETETTKTEVNTNVAETKTTTIDKENNVVKEVTEITPDDKSKPASVKLPNGQTIDITNAKYRNEKTTDLSKEKSVSLSKYELIQKDLKQALKIAETLYKENIELKQKLKNKEVVKETIFTWQFWLFFFLLLLLLIAMVYVGWKKRKELFL